MLSGYTIIIPLGSPWDFHAELEKPTALLLSKKNKVIIFQEKPGITFFSLIRIGDNRRKLFRQISSFRGNLVFFPTFALLPLQRLLFIERLNEIINCFALKIYAKYLKKDQILWMFYPRHSSLIKQLSPKISIYDCVDNHSSLDESENVDRQKDEKRMIDKTNIVFVNSKPLFDLQKRAAKKKIHLVAQGFDPKLFLEKRRFPIPMDIATIPRPRIGFVGNFDHRIDFSLVYGLAKANKRWSFVFVGPQTEDDSQSVISKLKKWRAKLGALENVYFIGRRPRRSVSKYIDSIDIGLIPYDISQPFCEYCYPTKTFEFLLRGKPLVATPIRALKLLSPYVQTAGSGIQLSKIISRLLAEGITKKQIKEQKRVAMENSWEIKIEQISERLASCVKI